MKLYYDMLVPYMPDAVEVFNEETKKSEFVYDDKKAAGRKAMVELSTFQMTNNITNLYHSVIYACKYADADLVDTILNMPEDINVESGVTVEYLLDESAKCLFRSIKPSTGPFDINKFTVNILTAAHAIMINMQNQQQQVQDDTGENKDD